MSRHATSVAILVAALLRGLPLLAAHLGVEHQEAYPQRAVLAVVEGSWKPLALVHGSLLSDVLRVLATAAWGVGHVGGRYAERADLLADFVRTPFPFVVAGRLVLLTASLASIWLAARVAARVGGAVAGAAAAVVLAVCAGHVRESLHVWPDALAATAAVATIAAALAHLDRGTTRSALLLGVLAGVALAAKPTVAPLGIPVALALWWGHGATRGSRMRRLALATAAAALAFLALSPYWVVDWRELALTMRVQMAGAFGAGPPTRLPWSGLLGETFGAGVVALAVAGIAAARGGDRRAMAIVAAFPVLYLGLLARGNPFARYFVVAAPLVAVLAGVGVAAIASLATPRRRGLVAAALVVGACAEPAWRSAQLVALVRRPDTRVLAGAWLRDHVPAGTAVTLPNLAGYPNPVVAPDAGTLRLRYPAWQAALVARGLGDPARTFRLRYQGLLSNYDGSFAPRDPIVVTAAHPSPMAALRTPVVNDERLRVAGYRVAARFEGAPDPLPARVVYDPQDADYLPLGGAERVPRLGPTLTIWRAP